MIAAWIFGVTFGFIAGFGTHDVSNKKPCVIGEGQSCVVLKGESNEG